MWKKVVVGGVLLFGMMMAFACVVLALFVPGRQAFTPVMEQRYVTEDTGAGQGAWSDSQIRVRLIDDDGDGIPDRGIANAPESGSNEEYVVSVERQSGRYAGGRSGGYGPMRMGRHFSRPIFSLMGGLLRLVGLAAIVIVGIAFFRRRKHHSHRSEE